MAYTTVQRRLPGSSDFGGGLSETKQQLVEEMSEFTKEGDRVNPTDSQLRLAEHLVRTNDPTRYVKIPFGNIVQQNQDEGCMDMMATAFDVLFRYTVNMLKLKRPRNWHTIKFTNAQFKARADCMIGTRNILKIMGYTEPVCGEGGKQNGLNYPDPSQIVQDYIKLIGAELLIAKVEIRYAQENGTQLQQSFLPGPRNVQLENPNLVPERPPFNMDEMYTSNINSQYVPPQFSSQRGPPPPSEQLPSQYGSIMPSEHSSVDSYRTNPGNYSMDPSQYHRSIQQPDSYGQSNLPQPRSNFGGQSGYQYDHQPRDQGSRYHDHHPSQDMIVEDVESHSSTYLSQKSAPEELMNSAGSDDMSAKLEELKRKKADLKKYFDPNVPSTESSRTTFSSQSHTTRTAPIAVLPPVPRPRKNRPSPAKPPQIQEEELRPSDSSNVPSTNQDVPPQRPSVAPRMTRIMMECDSCYYLNHERSLECIDCSNPRNERWRKVPMPSRPNNTPQDPTPQDPLPQPSESTSVAQANTSPSSDRVAVAPTQYDNQPPPDRLTAQHTNQQTAAAAQYNNQQTAAAGYGSQQTAGTRYNNQQIAAAAGYDNQQTAAPGYNDQPTARARHNDHPTAATAPSGRHGATGSDSSVGIIAQGFLPPPKIYTPEQKKILELEAEKKKESEEKMQQQQQHRSTEAQAGFQNFLPRNGNYNWGHQENGGMKRPTGKAYSDNSSDSDPQFYKNLGFQGQCMIHDLKEGLKYKYMLEEIQLASEIRHGYQTHYEFLQREWNTYIERTSFRVNQLGEEFHREKRMRGSIGRPKRNEIVKALIEERGDCEKAAQRCCTNRIKMIQELMREVQLPQSAAVLALERNGLDMDKAIRDIYREKMNSNALYAHIWGELEGGGIRQKQNDRVKQMIKENYPKNYLQRLLMAEYKLPTSGNCDVLIHLVRQLDLTVGACLDVAMMNDKVEAAVQLLTQECPICTLEYMRDKMINMVHCDHAVCKECFIQHFSLVVGEKSIKHCNCLVCGQPDMSSETIDMDLYLQLFSGLIQVHMNKEQYNLFMQKINERTMMKDPNFRWCIKCTIGFINDAGREKVECPNAECRQQMCFNCKKPWEIAHDGATCEQFAQWKKDNDPELQAQGLAAYLNEEGIECPDCKFKYALAKGGCMHFKCGQCPAEFCSGCNEFFKKDCTKYQSCRNKGLHAHHPRDCLFYLRDESVEDLQKLLKDNNVEFDTEPPEGQVMAEARKGIQAVEGQVVVEDQPAVPAEGALVLKCRVMLQKENANGPPIDEECGDAVESDHAGLCKKHYTEYLVFKINQSHIDPLPLYDTGPLRAILLRDEVKVPDQQPGEGEDQYAERLRELIKEKLPLKERAVTNF